MKIKLHSLFVGLALLTGIYQAAAQSIITAFSQNGLLICSGLQTGTVATVAWASALSGPWQTNWTSLAAVTVSNNGTITVSVPMFYRVFGVVATNAATTNPPAGMALIPAGTFTMGDVVDAGYPIYDNVPTTNIYVSAFYMDTNLVSYIQWQSVYNWATNSGYGFDSAGSGKASNHPVQTVNWYDVVKWSNARSQQAGLAPVYYTDAGMTQAYTNGDTDAVYPNWTANGYRLPTEAEWEKAARGGLSGHRFPWGDTISESQANYSACGAPCGLSYDLATYSQYNTNFDNGAYPYTSPVGTFSANAYGLNDMSGNVYEWCWDWYAPPPYPTGSPYLGGSDPRGPVAPLTARVMRGGDWASTADYLRCAERYIDGYPQTFSNFAIGIRCVKGL